MPSLGNVRFAKSYAHMLPRLVELIEELGVKQQDAAVILSDEGFTTPRGGPISQTTISRCMAHVIHQRELGYMAPTAAGATAAKQANTEAHDHRETPAPREDDEDSDDFDEDSLVPNRADLLRIMRQQTEHEKKQQELMRSLNL